MTAITNTGITKTMFSTKPKAAYGLSIDDKVIEFSGGGASAGGGWQECEKTPDMVISAVSLGTGMFGEGLGGPKWAIAIDWKDFGAPDWDVEKWQAITDFILTKDILSVHCQCAMGHGRTGSILSIIYQLATDKFDTVEKLVLHIRDLYDKEAVESAAQFAYIAKICGIEQGNTSGMEKHTVHVYNGNLGIKDETIPVNKGWGEFDKKYTNMLGLGDAKKIFYKWIEAGEPEVVGRGFGIKFKNVDHTLVSRFSSAKIVNGLADLVTWSDITGVQYDEYHGFN